MTRPVDPNLLTRYRARKPLVVVYKRFGVRWSWRWIVTFGDGADAHEETGIARSWLGARVAAWRVAR